MGAPYFSIPKQKISVAKLRHYPDGIKEHIANIEQIVYIVFIRFRCVKPGGGRAVGGARGFARRAYTPPESSVIRSAINGPGRPAFG
jgi:hypothetical protein